MSSLGFTKHILVSPLWYSHEKVSFFIYYYIQTTLSHANPALVVSFLAVKYMSHPLVNMGFLNTNGFLATTPVGRTIGVGVGVGAITSFDTGV